MDLKNGGKVTSLNTSILSSVNQKCGRMYVCMFGILLHLFLSRFLINFYTKSRQLRGQLLGSYFFFEMSISHIIFFSP